MDLFEDCCRSGAIWKEVLAAISQVILILDLDGRVLSASDAVEDAFGFALSDLKGKSFSLLFTPDDLSCYYPNLLFLARKGQPFEGEIMLVRRDGSRFVTYIMVRPHVAPKTGERLVFVFVQDAGRKPRRAEFFGKGFTKEDHYGDLVKIADGIAHEIRNPLVGIGGFVTRLFKSCPENETNRTYFDHIMGNLRKVENLIKKVEFFAKLPKPVFQETDLKLLIEGVAERYRERAALRGIDLALELQELTVLVDRDLIVRAISIFAENALDALPGSGRIAIRLESDDGDGIIQVTDRGRGISPEDLPFIFNPFFSTKPDGAGIDLAVVKRIAESHGGCVRVESSPGEGTSFYLNLPFERRRSIRIQRLEGRDTSERPLPLGSIE